MIKYQNIAPATLASKQNSKTDIKQKKYTSNSATNCQITPYSVDQTQSVQRRNARERNRVKQVNNSFSKLRQHIPQTIITDLTKGGGRGPHKKISKVDTLRIAVEYIRRLQDLVDDLNDSSSTTSSTTSSLPSSVLLSSNQCSDSNSSFSSSNTIQQMQTTIQEPIVNFLNTTQELQRSHLEQHQQQQQIYSSVLLTPMSLNDFSPPASTQTNFEQSDCQSPTSSFNSNLSFDSGTLEPIQQQFTPIEQTIQNIQMKYEPYDNFNLDDDNCTPDDEEILDYISLWQEQ